MDLPRQIQYRKIYLNSINTVLSGINFREYFIIFPFETESTYLVQEEFAKANFKATVENPRVFHHTDLLQFVSLITLYQNGCPIKSSFKLTLFSGPGIKPAINML